jgi:hypothetical protein
MLCIKHKYYYTLYQKKRRKTLNVGWYNKNLHCTAEATLARGWQHYLKT